MVHPPGLRPSKMRTHNAHEAVEHAKTLGVAVRLVARLYEAYWQEGRVIDDPAVIAELAAGIVDDIPELLTAVAQKRYAENIVPFDDPAHAKGVYYVPTFWIGGERYAEQPYSVLSAAVSRTALARRSLYAELDLPLAPADRPYLLMNMVATIDGKTVSGSRDDSVLDLGSGSDHETMHNLERKVDAVMIGANTLRASPRTWRPRTGGRVVVSASGDLPWHSSFLAGEPGKCFVIRPGDAAYAVPQGITPIEAGKGTADLTTALHNLRVNRGIRTLLVEGGSELNASLLTLNLVDELLLTIAPKVKLGRETPTYAGGSPLPREEMRRFQLVEEHSLGDEVFLRYRRI